MGKSDNVYRGRRKMMTDNFLGGIAWSAGVTFGGALIIALIAFFISKLNYIPVVGNFVLSIINYISTHQQPFTR